MMRGKPMADNFCRYRSRQDDIFPLRIAQAYITVSYNLLYVSMVQDCSDRVILPVLLATSLRPSLPLLVSPQTRKTHRLEAVL